MSEKIEPALTAEEWADMASDESGTTVWRGNTYGHRVYPCERATAGGADVDGYIDIFPEQAPLVIALANAALPDDDPRKITRETIDLLRIARDAGRVEGGAFGETIRHAGRPLHFGEQMRLCALADALESYLPPA